MPELRWTLLVLGVLFIVALAIWERRRSRQASNDLKRDLTTAPEPRGLSDARSELGESHYSQTDIDIESVGIKREPSFTLPEINVREPAHKIPSVDIADDSLDLRSEERSAHAHVDVVDEEWRIDEQSAADSAISDTRIDEEFTTGDEVEVATSEAIMPLPSSELEPASLDISDHDEEVREFDQPIEIGFAPDDVPREPIVDWPPPDKRSIVAVRLIGRTEERMSGRSLRQALAAEGFVHGKFSIYHKAGVDGRAILSAASLTHPGTFDLETIDISRFAGLNLFTVLPGPLRPQSAFDELIATSRALNARLNGILQDERGEPLTSAHVAAIRESLAPDAEGPPA